MKKFITLILLLTSLNVLEAKPKIKYDYDGSIFRFWLGGYDCIEQWNYYEGDKLTSIEVICREPGNTTCEAVFSPVNGTGEEGDWYNESELTTIHNLKEYAKNQIDSGVTQGSHNESITIQQGGNPAYTICFTITWNQNDSGTSTIEITNIIL
jgi:hypothetical protein